MPALMITRRFGPPLISIVAVLSEVLEAATLIVIPRDGTADDACRVMQQVRALVDSAFSVIPLIDMATGMNGVPENLSQVQALALREMAKARRGCEFSGNSPEDNLAAFELARRSLLHALGSLIETIAPHAVSTPPR